MSNWCKRAGRRLGSSAHTCRRAQASRAAREIGDSSTELRERGGTRPVVRWPARKSLCMQALSGCPRGGEPSSLSRSSRDHSARPERSTLRAMAQAEPRLSFWASIGPTRRRAEKIAERRVDELGWLPDETLVTKFEAPRTEVLTDDRGRRYEAEISVACEGRGSRTDGSGGRPASTQDTGRGRIRSPGQRDVRSHGAALLLRLIGRKRSLLEVCCVLTGRCGATSFKRWPGCANLVVRPAETAGSSAAKWCWEQRRRCLSRSRSSRRFLRPRTRPPDPITESPLRLRRATRLLEIPCRVRSRSTKPSRRCVRRSTAPMLARLGGHFDVEVSWCVGTSSPRTCSRVGLVPRRLRPAGTAGLRRPEPSLSRSSLMKAPTPEFPQRTGTC